MTHGGEPFPWLGVGIVTSFVLIFACAIGLGLWCAHS